MSPNPERQPLLGILLMVGAFACFAMLDATAKSLIPVLGTPLVVFGRYAFALLVVVAWVWQQGGLPILRTHHAALQVVRGLLLVASTATNFFALNYLQLAQTSAISFSNPLWVCALSPFLLGERIGPRRWAAVAIGFLGILLIIRPGSDGFHWAMFVSVASALFTALYQIATRKVGARDRALTSLFYVSLVGALAAAPATAFMKVEPAAWQWGLLAVMGVLGAIGHYMLTQAHRLAAAPVLAPYVYTQILWMILIGYLVFGNLPDGLTLVGGAVVIASGLYVFYREQGFEGGKADMTKPQIAVLGVGIMGYQQARRLLEAGYPVTGWNRSREKAERLLGHGGKVADSAAEAVRDADIALVMLSDGPTSDKVLDDGVLDAMRRGSLVLVMSSIPVETAQGQARRAAERGLRYVDAPVSGGEKGATEGTLAIMAGGDRKDFEKILPVLQAMGRATLVGLAGAGSLAKLCNQLIVGNTLSTVAEALLLARQGGADPEAVIRALSGGFADSPILQHHGRRMLAGNFAPGGRSSLQLKDLRTAKALAAKVGLELPVMGRVTELYEELVEKRGGADKDQSAVYLEIARRNGLKV